MWALRSCRRINQGFGECLQSGGIRVGSTAYSERRLRALPCCKCQGHPVAGSGLVTPAYGHFRVLSYGHQTGGFETFQTYAVGVYMSVHHLIGLPVPAGFGSGGGKLEHGGFRGISGIQVLMSVPRHTMVLSKKWNDLRARWRTVYTYHVHAAPYRSYRSDVFGTNRRQKFAGIEHLLHAGEGIDIQHPGTQLVERQMNARDTREYDSSRN